MSFRLIVILGYSFDTGVQGGRGGRGPFCSPPDPRPISPLCHCVVLEFVRICFANSGDVIG